MHVVALIDTDAIGRQKGLAISYNSCPCLCLWLPVWAGTIPTELGKLNGLEVFYLDHNKLTGGC